MTREELRRKVSLELSHRRQRAVTLAEERRADAYARQPLLAETENEKIRAGLELARMAAAGADETAVAAGKAKLAALDEKRVALLAGLGIAPDGLEPAFTCPVCQDTGRAGGQSCACARKLSQKYRREEINARFPLELCRFDTFRLDLYSEEKDPQLGISPRAQMEQVLRRCKAYAANFGPGSPSLYLMGQTGIGKTHLALSIAGEVLRQGRHVVYVSSQNLFFRMGQDREQAADLMDTLLDADLLVLDDLGTELVNASVIANLYNLVDTRMGRGLATIYTTNILDDALLEGRYTEKIASRLLGSCEVLWLLGDDLRVNGVE